MTIAASWCPQSTASTGSILRRTSKFVAKPIVNHAYAGEHGIRCRQIDGRQQYQRPTGKHILTKFDSSARVLERALVTLVQDLEPAEDVMHVRVLMKSNRNVVPFNRLPQSVADIQPCGEDAGRCQELFPELVGEREGVFEAVEQHQSVYSVSGSFPLIRVEFEGASKIL
ncbi:hypothetical protein [Caballeronia hypogeia]|uniref:hypothetical protein n=1 Tax=Caballeronia hypogeia TaxID=1777140 RepID=UPI0012FD7B05|nr:hypothetical protein [Caballeronia hypogeia]